MMNCFKYAPFIFGFVFSTQATILKIPYVGGTQTGTFQINGNVDNMPDSPYVDTLVIDSNVVVTHFWASNPARNFYCSMGLGTTAFEYGLSIQTLSGVTGIRDSIDTVWTNAKTFPVSLISLDTGPPVPYIGNMNLRNPPRALNIAIMPTDGECQPGLAQLISGYNSVVYFLYQRGSTNRYGKMMYNTTSRFCGGLTGPGCSYVTVSYTVADTTDLDYYVPKTPILLSPPQNSTNIPYYTNLVWLDSSLAISYHLQLSTDSTFNTTLVNDSTVTSTSLAVVPLSYSVGPLAYNTSYYWRVREKTSVGVSNYSNIGKFFTTYPVPQPPILISPPQNDTLALLPTSLTWNASIGAAKYNIQLATDSFFNYQTLFSSPYTYSKLPSGVYPYGTYYWRVSAVDTAGGSAFSNAWSFTIAKPSSIKVNGSIDNYSSRPKLFYNGKPVNSLGRTLGDKLPVEK